MFRISACVFRVGGSCLLFAGTYLSGCSSDSGPPAPPAPDEYVDASGRCRKTFEPGMFGCEDTYAAALALPDLCGTTCAGPGGTQRLFLRDCTPALRCAYDEETRELVGAWFGDDVPSHCDGSYSVVAGDFPEEPVLNGYDLELACAPPAELSVSPLFNTVYDPALLPATGAACRSGRDQCRGPVRAFVCLSDRGTIAGDGACAHCRTDDDCRREYAYASEVATCSPAGLCTFGSDLVGACSGHGSNCFTADAAFVCQNGLCAQCTSNAECSASGPYNLCLEGICLRSEPQP